MTGHLPVERQETAVDHPAAAGIPIDRVSAYEDAIRNIAVLVYGVRRLRRPAGLEFVSCVEEQLAALAALGFVPPEPDPNRRPLTAPVQP